MLLWAITQHVVVIPYRRFGTICRANVQGSRIQEDSLPRIQEDSWPLQMGPKGCRETSENSTIRCVIAQKRAVLKFTWSLHRKPSPILFEYHLNVNRNFSGERTVLKHVSWMGARLWRLPVNGLQVKRFS